jgi:hypothetical protein
MALVENWEKCWVDLCLTIQGRGVHRSLDVCSTTHTIYGVFFKSHTVTKSLVLFIAVSENKRNKQKNKRYFIYRNINPRKRVGWFQKKIFFFCNIII